MKMRKITIFLALVLLSCNIFAQNKLAEIEPRDHKISLTEVAEYEARFASAKTVPLETPKEFNFELKQVQDLVNKVNGSWFTISKGLDKEGNENVILKVRDIKGQMVGVYALQSSYPCPPWCD